MGFLHTSFLSDVGSLCGPAPLRWRAYGGGGIRRSAITPAFSLLQYVPDIVLDVLGQPGVLLLLLIGEAGQAGGFKVL